MTRFAGRLDIPLCLFAFTLPATAFGATVEIPLDRLADKIQGGLLGQILGNLNGLPHEMKYIDEPGNVAEYVPALPDGARTDDDTDIEWLYIVAMHQTGRTLLPPEQIVQLWKAHVNDHVWCANLYARRLMDLGIAPPLTGRIALNPWSEFNISGQFVAEAFGLICPAMPQTAGRIGLHYTHVAIDGEPAQATQLFAGMIATAFIETDIDGIIDAGLQCVDHKSAIAGVVRDVRQLHGEFPGDWRAARKQIRDKYTRFDGDTRDKNGYELNTAAVIGSLLYGKGDFRETLRLAFNFGWDADCNAATAGTVVGVIKGRRWMNEQGWPIGDAYKNVTRPGMPQDETITGYGRRLIEVARRVIRENGGEELTNEISTVLRIARQEPANVESLPEPLSRNPEGARFSSTSPSATPRRLTELRADLREIIATGLTGDETARARAAYLTFCLGEADRLQAQNPDRWADAIQALKLQTDLLKLVAKLPSPSGDQLKAQFRSAGLIPDPATKPR